MLLITFKVAVSGLGPSDRQDLIGPYVPSHTPCSETVDCHGRLTAGASVLHLVSGLRFQAILAEVSLKAGLC